MNPHASERPEADPQAETWMREAFAEAEAAAEADEPPVGAIVLDGEGRVVGRGRDARQAPGDPLAHAEVTAIRGAAQARGDWRLDGYTLVVTLEPCPMCAGLILMARIETVYYGAANVKWGSAGTKTDLLTGGAFPHKPRVIGGVLAEECSAILTRYFGRLRERDRTAD